MGTLHTVSAPPPSPHVTGDRPPVASAYFAVTVDAAADLRAARDYRDLPRPERVARAQAEQLRFLDQFLDPGLRLALDLRIAADPGGGPPLSMALLGRVWDTSAAEATARAGELRQRVHAALPGYVVATPVEDAGAVARMLTPFPGAAVDSAVITRHELIGQPSRPDAGVSYYYSASPLHQSADDWSAVYTALAASPVPVILSVAVLPLPVPAPFAQTMRTLASYYGRLAADSEAAGGRYPGQPRLAPDPFAVHAEQAFLDYSGRFAQQAFALRIQVSAARQLPPGVVETIAEAISPGEPAGRFPGHQRTVVPGYDVRRPNSVAERRLAEYNLSVINFGMLTGQPEIWERPDPPDPQLALLSVLGDARDAARAFRFPVAADGVVPGFTVQAGPAGPALASQPGEAGLSDKAGRAAEAGQLTLAGPQTRAGAADSGHLDEPAGPVIRLGQVAGTSRDIALPVSSLTGPALIAGAAGSGTSTTARAILRQLWAGHQIPFLVIVPAGSAADGYRGLAAEPGFETLEVITVGDETARPLRFNPFEVPPGTGVGEHAANLLTCFQVSFGLSGALSSVYQDALALTYLRAGFLAVERPGGTPRAWPTVTNFLAAMTEVASDPGYPDAIQPGLADAVRRARQLVRGPAASALLTDQRGGAGRLLGHPVILELLLPGPGEEQTLLTALLLTAVTGHARAVRGASADLAHVTLVEEAQRLLARSPGGQPAGTGLSPDAAARERAAGAFAAALAENRRHGEGVMLVGRSPGQLVPEAVQHTGLKIMHRLPAEDDRRVLGDAMGLDDAQRTAAARLPGGQALVDGGQSTEAVRADIAAGPLPGPPRGAPPGPPPESSPAGPEAPAGAPAVTPPFAICGPCRAQCTYRGAALSLVNDPRTAASLMSAARALEAAGDTPAAGPAGLAEPEAGLAELRGLLYDTVGQFAALPQADPGRADAAFCLFLHVHASSAPPLRTEWPAVAARFLGLTTSEE
jgi:hypothetical protein